MPRINGQSGHNWIEGAGVPSPSIGSNHQFYLNTTTGDIYQKTSSTVWTLRGDMQVPFTSFGAVAPTSTQGKIGDVYINYVSFIMYEKTGINTWTARCKVLAP